MDLRSVFPSLLCLANLRFSKVLFKDAILWGVLHLHKTSSSLLRSDLSAQTFLHHSVCYVALEYFADLSGPSLDCDCCHNRVLYFSRQIFLGVDLHNTMLGTHRYSVNVCRTVKEQKGTHRLGRIDMVMRLACQREQASWKVQPEKPKSVSRTWRRAQSNVGSWRAGGGARQFRVRALKPAWVWI